MRLIFAMAPLVLAACTTTGSLPISAPQINAPLISERSQAVDDGPRVYQSLPTQTLTGGDCGLFLFGVRDPHAFTVFEDESTRRVKILHEGEVIETDVSEPSGSFIAGEAFGRVYQADEQGLRFTLTGQVGAQTPSGQALHDVVLRARAQTGHETVQPLGGVRTCRGSSAQITH